MARNLSEELLYYAALLKGQGVNFGNAAPEKMYHNAQAIECPIGGALNLALWLDYGLGEKSLFCGFSANVHKPIDDLIALAPSALRPVRIIPEHTETITRDGKTWYASTLPDRAKVFGLVVLERLAEPPESYYGIYFRPHEFDVSRAALFIKEVRAAITRPVTNGIDQVLHNEAREMQRTVRDRSKSVRIACLGHYGRVCCGCDLDCDQFGEKWGIIEVHHLNPIALGERSTDPVDDCRPLCPTCHRLAHFGQPVNKPLGIVEVRKLRGLRACSKA